MRIAIVSDAIYPYNKGGKEKRIYEISTRLAKLGHEVHIYCMKWWDRARTDPNHVHLDSDQVLRGPNHAQQNENHRIENGVHLHAISPYYPLYSGERRSISQAILFGIGCWKLILENFDVIDVDHMPFFPLFSVKLVCLIKRKRLFATWHEVWGKKYWKEYLGALGIVAFWIEKLSVYLPDKIISVSHLTAGKLKKDFKYKKAISVIPNGINYEEIDKVKPSKIKSDIIFVGRLLKHKNVDVLLQAIKLLAIDHLKCLIIGDGPEKNNLINLTKELNLDKNIVFYDSSSSQEEVFALMKSSRVFVLPSTREGFGIVVLEANACGLPVITTSHPDNAAKDLVKNNINGLITSLDENKIVDAIKKILNKKITFDLSSDKFNSWRKLLIELIEFYQYKQ